MTVGIILYNMLIRVKLRNKILLKISSVIISTSHLFTIILLVFWDFSNFSSLISLWAGHKESFKNHCYLIFL